MNRPLAALLLLALAACGTAPIPPREGGELSVGIGGQGAAYYTHTR